MPKLNQSRRQRAPRVSVPNREQATIRVGSKDVVAKICKISITGGLLYLPGHFAKGSFAEISFDTTSGKIVSAIEFLGTSGDGVNRAQAFHFIQMHPEARMRLGSVVQQLQQNGFGDRRGGVLHAIEHLAQRALRMVQGRRRSISDVSMRNTL